MMIQGSEEWRLARCGWVGASRVADIIAKTKSGWSASRANYMAQLIAERLTGKPMETFTSEAMQWGTETEDKARTIYAFMYDAEIEQTGFVKHPRIPMAGASPDGFIGDAGLLEIKCPNTATHIDTLLGHSVPGKYVTQMQFQMACTGRSWCDFVSYDPRLPEHMSLFVHRVPRDDKLIGELEDQVEQFLADLDKKLSQLNERFAVRDAA
jgi:putative phage-type endonuclease